MASPKVTSVRALFHAAQRAAEAYWAGADLDSRLMREQVLTGATPQDARIFDTFFVDRIRVLLDLEGGFEEPTPGRAVRVEIRFGKPRPPVRDGTTPPALAVR